MYVRVVGAPYDTMKRDMMAMDFGHGKTMREARWWFAGSFTCQR